MSEKVKPEKSDYRTSIHAAAACGMSEIQMCCSVRFIAV